MQEGEGEDGEGETYEQVVEAWILFGPKAPSNEARVSFLDFYSQVYCVFCCL